MAANTISIGVALRSCNDDLLIDDVPVLLASALSIQVDIRHREDAHLSNLYDTDFSDEMKAIHEMKTIAKIGEDYIQMLYSFRGCSRALLAYTDSNDTTNLSNTISKETTNYPLRETPTSTTSNLKTYQILQPEMKKLLELVSFHQEFIDNLCKNIQKLVTPERKRKVIPAELNHALLNMIDILVQLDGLKDMKACLQNDFSLYKRCFLSAKDHIDNQEVVSKEIHELQLFLGNPQYPKALIFHHLKTAVQKIIGYEDVLIEMQKTCIEHLDSSLFLNSDDKFKLLRPLPHLLLLLDDDHENNSCPNVFKNKKIKLEKVLKLIRRYPVIPLFGDMALKTSSVVERSPNFLSSPFVNTLSMDAKTKIMYDITASWKKARSEFDEHAPKFSRLVNMAITDYQQDKMDELQYAKEVYEVFLSGLQCLSRWKTDMMMQISWKYQKPITQEQLKKTGANEESKGIEYERVVRYNYSKEEITALVDTISLIKSFGGIMQQHESLLLPYIRLHIHNEVQVFAQQTCSRFLYHAEKKKRSSKTALLQLRSLIGDWGNLPEPVDNYKTKEEAYRVDKIIRRYTPPSPIQLQLMRAILRSLYDERSIGMQSTGLFCQKDFDSSDIAILQDLYHRSFFYPYLLNSAQTLNNLTNLGQLWYREFFLEMTKCIQFPIEMSIPWILTEHMISDPTRFSSHILESIVSTMDIYNDAANIALYELQRQFLFDEIQAEVNLCFDQLIFLLGDQIYSHYKNVAALSLLDKPYKQKLQSKGGNRSFHVENRRYIMLMKQRHIQILGRSMDINQLISQHIASKLFKDLELAFLRLEASDLSYILEFESLLRVLQLTHQLLDVELSLGSFQDMYDQVNESICSITNHGRIVIYLLSKLLSDLFPNYAYNTYTKRYIRSSKSYGEGIKESTANKSMPESFLFGPQCRLAYESMHRLNRGFVGLSHLAAIRRLTCWTDLALLLEECLNNMEEKLKYVLSPSIRALAKAIPPCKLPKYIYKTGGKLKGVLEYKDLKPQVFQSFREVGNTLAFFYLLDTSLNVSSCFNQNMLTIPSQIYSQQIQSSSTYSPVQENSMNEKDKNHPSSSLTASSTTTTPSTEKKQEKENHALQRTGVFIPSEFLNVFQFVIHKWNAQLDTIQVREEWQGDNEILQVENTTEFYHLWSALQFLFCIPEQDDRDNFGDGFSWAGCSLIHLLNQKHRFQVYDFTYHVLNVWNYEKIAETHDPTSVFKYADKSKAIGDLDQEMKSDCNGFLKNAQAMQRLNCSLFSLFQTTFQTLPSRCIPQTFHPPREDTLEEITPQHFVSLATDQSSQILQSNELRTPSTAFTTK